MAVIGSKTSVGLVILAVVALTRPIHAEDIDPEYQELIRRGNSQIRTGATLMWTGAALLPLAALALVPVLHDGAFGITAADPGFAIFFAAAGGGLIHAGIPVYGSGAGNLEKAAGGSTPGGLETAEAGWSHYRRSWKFMAGGSAVLVSAFPLAIVAALDFEKRNQPLHYVVGAMGITGLGLIAFGVLEQHYSLYRFSQAAGNARDRLQAVPQVSLQPIFLLDRQGPGAGMRLACSF